MRTVTATFFSIALAAAAFGCQRSDRTMTQPASMEQPPSAYGGGPASSVTENASETEQSSGIDDPNHPTKIDNGPMQTSPLTAEDQAGATAGSSLSQDQGSFGQGGGPAATDGGSTQPKMMTKDGGISNPSLVPRDMSGAPPAGAPPYSAAPYTPMP